jgi:hypothetical protein
LQCCRRHHLLLVLLLYVQVDGFVVLLLDADGLLSLLQLSCICC